MTKTVNGKACLACGSTVRYVSGGCVECSRARNLRRSSSGQHKLDCARYYVAHGERRRREAKEAYEENPEIFKSRVKTFRLHHPEVGRTATAQRRARKTAALGDLTAADERRIRRDSTHCYYCDVVLAALDKAAHLDHMTPLSRGGKHSIDNVVMSCSACNLAKHTLTAEEFIEYRKRGRP